MALIWSFTVNNLTINYVLRLGFKCGIQQYYHIQWYKIINAIYSILQWLYGTRNYFDQLCLYNFVVCFQQKYE